MFQNFGSFRVGIKTKLNKEASGLAVHGDCVIVIKQLLRLVYLKYLPIIRILIQDFLQLLYKGRLDQAKTSTTSFRCQIKEIFLRPNKTVRFFYGDSSPKIRF